MKPIIMSGNHPRLILDGLKTMTRRTYGLEEINKSPNEWLLEWFNPRTGIASFVKGDVKNKIMEITDLKVKCPYGQVGDRLWVRETLYKSPSYDVTNGKHFAYYKANDIIVVGGRWQWQKDILPSIFMPRWASRITLEITEVRVERLQEITEGDAISEGIKDFGSKLGVARNHFMVLWDSLNAKRGYGWDTNCWVWAISFRKI